MSLLEIKLRSAPRVSGAVREVAKGDKGEAGGYYIPAKEYGKLAWTPSQEDMPAVEPVDIPIGDPGFSPVVAIDGIEGGHRVTITDASGSQSFDVFDGVGETGPVGPQGEKGDTGAAGANGVSATHSWNGTILTVTSASGTSSADLKGDTGATGPQGEKGDAGTAGYTPVKGTDYYTAADKAEMVDLVLAALPVAEEANF